MSEDWHAGINKMQHLRSLVNKIQGGSNFSGRVVASCDSFLKIQLAFRVWGNVQFWNSQDAICLFGPSKFFCVWSNTLEQSVVYSKRLHLLTLERSRGTWKQFCFPQCHCNYSIDHELYGRLCDGLAIKGRFMIYFIIFMIYLRFITLHYIGWSEKEQEEWLDINGEVSRIQMLFSLEKYYNVYEDRIDLEDIST